MHPVLKKTVLVVWSKSYIRYFTIGAFNTVSGFALFAVLNQFLFGRVRIGLILFIATVLSNTLAFVWQKYFVWKVSGRFRKQFFKFALICILNFSVNLACLQYLVEDRKFPVYPSQIGIVSVISVINFYVLKKWTFHTND